jgi:hypothetical protein
LAPAETEFSESEAVFLEADSSISIRLDLFQHADLVQTDVPIRQGVDNRNKGSECGSRQLGDLAALFDWDHILLELLTFKASKPIRNLAFNATSLRAIIESGQYEFEGPIDTLTVRTLDDFRRIQ